MLKISSNRIKKVFLQNQLINYLTNDFKFVLFFKQFDGGINDLNLIKENNLNVNTKYLNLNYKNLHFPLSNKKNKFYNIKNLFLNKGILMVKFNTFKELNYFLQKNNLLLNENISLLGGIIDFIFWNSNDLKLLQKINNENNFNKLKFNLFYNSFNSVLNFILLLNNIKL